MMVSFCKIIPPPSSVRDTKAECRPWYMLTQGPLVKLETVLTGVTCTDLVEGHCIPLGMLGFPGEDILFQ